MLLQQVLLLCLLGLAPLLEAKPGRTCIRYETYQVTSYGMQTYRDPLSHWYSHRAHRLPNKYTRISLRGKPSICCDLGYMLVKATSDCIPVCTACSEDEQCVAPNICMCKEGYRRTVKISHGLLLRQHCTPVLATTSTPTNTTVIVAEEATTPLETTAAEFLTTTTIRTPTTTTTQPTTSAITTTPNPTPSAIQATTPILSERDVPITTGEPCGGLCDVNELCVEGICVCKEGYEGVVSNRTSKCEPTCKPVCQHANCVGPNVCACWPGYGRTDERSCHAVCSKETCTFGNCSESGTCICLQGFRSSGIGCIWAGDAILSEPKNCNCWLSTHTNEEQCRDLCDSAAQQSSMDCINATLCQYSGMALACPDRLYTCSSSVAQSNHKLPTTDKVNESAGKMSMLIVGFIASILVIGVLTYVWLKHRHRFSRPSLYRSMSEGGEGDEGAAVL